MSRDNFQARRRPRALRVHTKYTTYSQKSSKAPPRVQQSPSITLAAFYSVQAPAHHPRHPTPPRQRSRDGESNERTAATKRNKNYARVALHNALKKHDTSMRETRQKKKGKKEKETAYFTRHQHSTRRVTREKSRRGGYFSKQRPETKPSPPPLS